MTYPRSARGAYTFSTLATFPERHYNNAGFTQTFGVSSVSQTNPNFGMYAQDEWKITPRVTLNAGLRYDLQFIDTIETDTNNLSPRVGVVVGAVRGAPHDRARERWALLRSRAAARGRQRAAVGQQHDGSREPAARSTSSLSPAQAGAPVFPNVLAGQAPPSATLPNLTTMDRQLQNAYSRQASVEIEQQIGERATVVSAGYHYIRGLQSVDVDQSERPDLRRVRREQRLPPDSRLRQQQPVFRGGRLRTITACTSRSCSGRRRGGTIACRIRCRSR